MSQQRHSPCVWSGVHQPRLDDAECVQETPTDMLLVDILRRPCFLHDSPA